MYFRMTDSAIPRQQHGYSGLPTPVSYNRQNGQRLFPTHENVSNSPALAPTKQSPLPGNEPVKTVGFPSHNISQSTNWTEPASHGNLFSQATGLQTYPHGFSSISQPTAFRSICQKTEATAVRQRQTPDWKKCTSG